MSEGQLNPEAHCSGSAGELPFRMEGIETPPPLLVFSFQEGWGGGVHSPPPPEEFSLQGVST
ncbi:hypothetical protein ACILE2_08400 [Capnocytophaga canimorsus]|uniref:hypothetical protein n=1 Tax=Capnocytophaga canimorsus TaxID=28188 RepID=UPI0037D77DD9